MCELDNFKVCELKANSRPVGYRLSWVVDGTNKKGMIDISKKVADEIRIAEDASFSEQVVLDTSDNVFKTQEEINSGRCVKDMSELFSARSISFNALSKLPEDLRTVVLAKASCCDRVLLRGKKVTSIVDVLVNKHSLEEKLSKHVGLRVIDAKLYYVGLEQLSENEWSVLALYQHDTEDMYCHSAVGGKLRHSNGEFTLSIKSENFGKEAPDIYAFEDASGYKTPIEHYKKSYKNIVDVYYLCLLI